MTDEETIEKYLSLIRSYTEGKMSAIEFMLRYLDEFKREEVEMSNDVYAILDYLFGSADFYSEDPELRWEYGIDEDELMDDAIEAQRKLEALLSGTDPTE